MKQSRTLARLGLSSLLLLLLAAPVAAEQARLGLVSGEVSIGRGDPPAWSAASSGDLVSAGAQIRTGRDGRAELVWQGATIRLYGDSLLRLPDAQRGVALDRGNGLFDVIRRARETFEVETPEVVVSVKGTRFAVEQGEGPASVSVYRGSVGVRAVAETLRNEVMVHQGFRALGGRGGPAELFLLRGEDPWQSWGPGARPPRTARVGAPDASARAAALREARAMARRVYQQEALASASKRDAKLARSVDRLQRAKAEKRSALGDGRGRLAPGQDAERPSPARLDPVADAGLDKVEMALQTQFIQAWVNGIGPAAAANGGGGGVASANFSVTPEQGNKVRVDETVNGDSWLFNRGQLQSILVGGQSIPPDLATTLNAAGVSDPQQFIQMLLVVATGE